MLRFFYLPIQLGFARMEYSEKDRSLTVEYKGNKSVIINFSFSKEGKSHVF